MKERLLQVSKYVVTITNVWAEAVKHLNNSAPPVCSYLRNTKHVCSDFDYGVYFCQKFYCESLTLFLETLQTKFSYFNW